MDDKEKIKAAIAMLKQLKKMVGFFMKKEIGELIEKLEAKETKKVRVENQEPRAKNQDFLRNA